MRILVVEDEHKIARAIKKALEHESYAVDVSFDGDDGFAMASTEPYDLIVLDRMLPGRDGISILKELRTDGNHVPILLLTALGRVEDKTEGLDAGADDYLAKPFALTELLARVRALLRRPSVVQPTVLTIADLSMDTANMTVMRAEKHIQLTSKEFALLEYLLRNQQRPVSKDMIIQHVWDYDADILPNTVEVYVKYLRNKIDKPFDLPLLHTMRGFGYKLEARE